MKQTIRAMKRNRQVAAGARCRALFAPGAVRGYAALLALLGVASGTVNAQVAPPETASVRSHSGQFLVYAQRATGPGAAYANRTTDRDHVRLEPPLLAVSCERIKQFLSRELGAGAAWRGKIFLALHPARASGQTITITSERFKTTWQYQVDLPEVVERERYVRAIVQVLLLEMANREANSRLAEVPLWLTEGLTQQLLTSNEIEIILPPQMQTVNGLEVKALVLTERKTNTLEQARQQLGARPPLSFEQLSWPPEGEWAGDTAGVYRGSAQLFVSELQHLPDGRACLRAMLARLPQYYNWQFAFLNAFHAHFERLLDVEKWWALCTAQTAGRDLAPVWLAEESWQKLDQTIRSAAQAQAGATEPASRADVTLQTIIREWGRAQQDQALASKLRELALLRPRVAPEPAVLVEEYSQALEAYLHNRHRTSPIFRLGRKAHLSRIAEETLQRLDALDARREALRPAPAPAAAGPAPHKPASVP